MTADTAVITLDEIRRIRGVLHLCGVRRDDLEDAVQEVCLRAVRTPPRPETRGAWLSATAANLAVDYARRAATRQGLVDRLARTVGMWARSPDVAVVESVRAALAQLAPDLRAVVVLRYYADMSVPETAAALEIPEGTVKSRLHRAAAVLREQLRDEET